jgi:hypothetical protein
MGIDNAVKPFVLDSLPASVLALDKLIPVETNTRLYETRLSVASLSTSTGGRVDAVNATLDGIG